MSHRPSPDPADPLAAALGTAAEAAAPPFSPSLHAAVMRRVRREAVAPAVARRRSTAPWAVAAVAAAAAAAVVLSPRRAAVDPPAVVPSPAVALRVPTVPAAVAAVANPIARRLADARHDYLDRSSERLAAFCRRQMDVVPIASLSSPPPPADPRRG